MSTVGWERHLRTFVIHQEQLWTGRLRQPVTAPSIRGQAPPDTLLGKVGGERGRRGASVQAGGLGLTADGRVHREASLITGLNRPGTQKPEALPPGRPHGQGLESWVPGPARPELATGARRGLGSWRHAGNNRQLRGCSDSRYETQGTAPTRAPGTGQVRGTGLASLPSLEVAGAASVKQDGSD